LHHIDGHASAFDDVRAHCAYLASLEARGVLELAGPFRDAPMGILVLRVASAEDARAIADADPFVTRGVRRAEIRHLDVATRDNNYLL
jgi:uncharacterized protein